MTDGELNNIDTGIELAMVHLIRNAKNTGRIVLNEFNPNWLDHRGLLYVASLVKTCTDWPIYIQMPLFKFLRFKRESKGQYDFKYCWRAKNTEDCDKIIDTVSTACKQQTLFLNIHNLYYNTPTIEVQK
jgi:hypothetical protein